MTSTQKQTGNTNTDGKENHPANGLLEQVTAELATYKKTLNEIYELYDKKIEELSLIRRIGDSVRTPLKLETLCRHIVDVVAQEISVDRVALLIVDEHGENIQVRASYDSLVDQTQYHHQSPAPTDSVLEAAEQALKTGGPVLLESAPSDQDPLSTGDGSPVALLFLPLIARDRPVGLLALSRSESHPFDQDDARVLAILSDQAATALANVRLFNQLSEANIALQESEHQARQTSLYLESLLEAANDVIFTVNNEGRITYVNRKASDWGFNKEDLQGQLFHTLVDGKGPDPLTAGLAVESTLITRSGEPRNVLFSTSRVPHQGEPSFLVLARDITERKELEKQLFHSEKLASIGILAAGVAHEIGNPLSAISGYAQILQSGETEPDEAREYLTAIEDQAARIQRIIEDLLSYSRPTAGHQSRITLNDAVPQILSMLQSQRAFKNLEVAYVPSDSPVEVEMDRDHLAQLIVNISLNAAQAMPEGGSLTIRAEQKDDLAVIRLSDTGPGIPPEIQTRIFDPFFTTKTAGQGTGLGLAICHRIVESLNGSIHLESDADSGTTFTINLPAVNALTEASK